MIDQQVPYLDERQLSQASAKSSAVLGSDRVLHPLQAYKDPSQEIKDLNEKIRARAASKYKHTLVRVVYPYYCYDNGHLPLGKDGVSLALRAGATTPVGGSGKGYKESHAGSGKPNELQQAFTRSLSMLKDKLWKKSYRHSAKKLGAGAIEVPERPRHIGIKEHLKRRYFAPSLPERLVPAGADEKSRGPPRSSKGLIGSSGPLSRNAKGEGVYTTATGSKGSTSTTATGLEARGGHKVKVKVETSSEESSSGEDTEGLASGLAPRAAGLAPRAAGLAPVASGGAIVATIAAALAPIVIKGVQELSRFIHKKRKAKKAKHSKAPEANPDATSPTTLVEPQPSSEPKASEEARPETVAERQDAVAAEGAGKVPTPYQQERASQAAREASKRGLVGFPNPLSYPEQPPAGGSYGGGAIPDNALAFFRDIYDRSGGILRKLAEEAGYHAHQVLPFIDKYLWHHAKTILGHGAAKKILKSRRHSKPFKYPLTVGQLVEPLLKLNIDDPVEWVRWKRYLSGKTQRAPKGAPKIGLEAEQEREDAKIRAARKPVDRMFKEDRRKLEKQEEQARLDDLREDKERERAERAALDSRGQVGKKWSKQPEESKEALRMQREEHQRQEKEKKIEDVVRHAKQAEKELLSSAETARMKEAMVGHPISSTEWLKDYLSRNIIGNGIFDNLSNMASMLMNQNPRGYSSIPSLLGDVAGFFQGLPVQDILRQAASYIGRKATKIIPGLRNIASSIYSMLPSASAEEWASSLYDPVSGKRKKGYLVKDMPPVPDFEEPLDDFVMVPGGTGVSKKLRTPHHHRVWDAIASGGDYGWLASMLPYAGMALAQQVPRAVQGIANLWGKKETVPAYGPATEHGDLPTVTQRVPWMDMSDATMRAFSDPLMRAAQAAATRDEVRRFQRAQEYFEPAEMTKLRQAADIGRSYADAMRAMQAQPGFTPQYAANLYGAMGRTRTGMAGAPLAPNATERTMRAAIERAYGITSDPFGNRLPPEGQRMLEQMDPGATRGAPGASRVTGFPQEDAEYIRRAAKKILREPGRQKAFTRGLDSGHRPTFSVSDDTPVWLDGKRTTFGELPDELKESYVRMRQAEFVFEDPDDLRKKFWMPPPPPHPERATEEPSHPPRRAPSTPPGRAPSAPPPEESHPPGYTSTSTSGAPPPTTSEPPKHKVEEAFESEDKKQAEAKQAELFKKIQELEDALKAPSKWDKLFFKEDTSPMSPKMVASLRRAYDQTRNRFPAHNMEESERIVFLGKHMSDLEDIIQRMPGMHSLVGVLRGLTAITNDIRNSYEKKEPVDMTEVASLYELMRRLHKKVMPMAAEHLIRGKGKREAPETEEEPRGKPMLRTAGGRFAPLIGPTSADRGARAGRVMAFAKKTAHAKGKSKT